MTNLDEMKKAILRTVRGQNMPSSACSDMDFYAKRWPFVLQSMTGMSGPIARGR
jgi:hypothetical protein